MARARYVCGEDGNRDVTQQVLAACGEPTVIVAASVVYERSSAIVRPARGDQRAMVRVQCTTNQWCDFACGAADDTTEHGTVVPEAEVARWKTWQDYTDPLKGLERIEKYAKWVLTANLFVVALATALSTSSTLSLGTRLAKWLYFVAVAFLGFSWVAVSFTLAPKWVRLHRSSPSEVLSAFNQQFAWRRGTVSTAAVFLGLALALAALVPLAGLASDPKASAAALTYEVKASGEITGQVAGEGLPPNTEVQLSFTAPKAPTGGALPGRRAAVGADGKVQASVTLDSTRAHSVERPLKLFGEWTILQDGAPVVKRKSVTFLR